MRTISGDLFWVSALLLQLLVGFLDEPLFLGSHYLFLFYPPNVSNLLDHCCCRGMIFFNNRIYVLYARRKSL